MCEVSEVQDLQILLAFTSGFCFCILVLLLATILMRLSIVRYNSSETTHTNTHAVFRRRGEPDVV